MDWGSLTIGIRGSVSGSLDAGYNGLFAWRDDLGPLDLGTNWTKIVAEAPFSPRDTGDPFIFGDALWLSNGYHIGGGLSRDLWRSSDDGRNWELVNADTPYDSYSRIEVLGDYMYAIRHSVWRSQDGITWEQVAASTPFENAQERFEMRATVFQDRIWVLAPSAAWSSEDGVVWTKEADLPFDPRFNFALTVFNDRLVLAGGFTEIPNDFPETGYANLTSFNDVWTSADGRTWELVTANADWSARQWLHMEEVNGLLYVFGGYSNREARNLNDMWVSRDGVTWTEIDLDDVWSGRHWSSVYTIGDQIILAAGNDSVPDMSQLRNDVWSYTNNDQLSSAVFSKFENFSIVLGAGRDDIQTGDGADILDGGAGDDVLRAGGGNDKLFGGEGADILDGGEGTDVLDGGEGADRLNGGLNDDRLIGGGVNEDRFLSSVLWLDQSPGAQGWHVADVNGDGRDDLFRYAPGVSGAEVFLSTGDGFEAAGSWTAAGSGADSWFLGDFNGDGSSDILRYMPGRSGAEVFLSNSGLFDFAGSWTSAGYGNTRWSVGDFNGDGRDDLMRYLKTDSRVQVLLSNGSAFSLPTDWALADEGNGAWLVGDFNGDGHDDLARRSNTGGIEVLLSNGTGFDAPQSWSESLPTGQWRIGDFNRDGRDDILIMSDAGVQAALSTGSGFRAAVGLTKEVSNFPTWNIGDFNGDGGIDLMRQLSAGADVLLAGAISNDVFVFETGFGHDVITDFAHSDTIEFAPGLFADFGTLLAAAQKVGDDVVITVDQANSLTLLGFELASLTADHFVFG